MTPLAICWCWARDGSSPSSGKKKSLLLERRDREKVRREKVKKSVALCSTEKKAKREKERSRRREKERSRRREIEGGE
jgi:hypothetical protein